MDSDTFKIGNIQELGCKSWRCIKKWSDISENANEINISVYDFTILVNKKHPAGKALAKMINAGSAADKIQRKALQLLFANEKAQEFDKIIKAIEAEGYKKGYEKARNEVGQAMSFLANTTNMLAMEDE